MNKVADAIASPRNVSAQEAVYRLTHMIPYQTVRILKIQILVTAMEDDEPDIFVANLLDHYAARPPVLGSFCLAYLPCGMRYLRKKNQIKVQISLVQLIYTMRSRICLATNCHASCPFKGSWNYEDKGETKYDPLSSVFNDKIIRAILLQQKAPVSSLKEFGPRYACSL